MGELTAGDIVLNAKNGSPASTRVIVNQHRSIEQTARLVTIHLAGGGHISLTADHVLSLDGAWLPARNARAGAALVGAHGEAVRIARVSSAIGAIVNPVVTSGFILAAAADGPAVLAATASEWSFDLMTSGYAPLSFSALITYVWPRAAQQYYDAWLEPVYKRAAPALAELSRTLPHMLAIACLALADVAQAAGFIGYLMCSVEALVALAAVFAIAAGRMHRKVGRTQ